MMADTESKLEIAKKKLKKYQLKNKKKELPEESQGEKLQEDLKPAEQLEVHLVQEEEANEALNEPISYENGSYTNGATLEQDQQEQEQDDVDYSIAEWKEYSNLQQLEIDNLNIQLLESRNSEQLVNQTSDLEKQQAENSLLKEEVSKLKNTLQQDHETHQRELDNLQTTSTRNHANEIIKLEKDLGVDHDMEISALKEELQNVPDANQSAKITILQLSERASFLAEENSALLQRIDTTRSEISQYLRKEESFKEHIKELEERIKLQTETSTIMIYKLQNETKAQKETIDHLKESLSVARSSSSQKIGEMENAMKLSRTTNQNVSTSPINNSPAILHDIHTQFSPSADAVPVSPILGSPLERGGRKKSHDLRSIAVGREQDLLTQLSLLTAKLLDLESQNLQLNSRIATDKDLQSQILHLESRIAQLRNELDKEQKVVILLQAEVDTLPDMIELYHKERKALLARINSSSITVSVKKDKEESEPVYIEIPCKDCSNQKIIYI